MEDPDKPTGNALIIDLKPNDAGNLSLYEIVEAWGHSACGWTPVMLRLKSLFCDEDASKFDRCDFTRTDTESSAEPIFSFYYARGTVRDGKLEGTWNLTAPGSANSALLWPDPMMFFCEMRWQRSRLGVRNLRTVGIADTRLLPGTKRLELHQEQPPAAARAERFAAIKTPQRGSGKSEQSQ